MCRIPPENLRRFERQIRDQPAAKRLLFEGDSWLSFPGAFGGNLFSRLSRRYRRRAASLQMAEPGDEAQSVLSGCQHQLLRDAIAHYQPEIVFYSGGGNDVIGDHLVELLKAAGGVAQPVPPRFTGMVLPHVVRNHVRLDAFDVALCRIESAYRTVLLLRDLYSRQTLLVGHCYDYAQASGIPGPFGRGPWIRHRFEEAGIPPADMATVIAFLIDAFHACLDDLATSNELFMLIDTRKTLSPVDWRDEIHPNPAGWQKLIERIGAKLDAKV